MKRIAKWYFNRKSWQRVGVGFLSWPLGVIIQAFWLIYTLLLMPIVAAEVFLEGNEWYFSRKSWQRVGVGLLSWPAGVIIMAFWLIYILILMPIAAVDAFLGENKK